MTSETAARSDPPRTAYLVLGMHRSGTSAVAELLALAGAELPKNLMPGDEHNAKGYFEPWKIALFNDERLRAAGSSWEDVFAYPYKPLAASPERAWLTRAEVLFEAEYGGRQVPLLKDPRVSLLIPFWRRTLEGLGIAMRCVIPVRHPLAVAGSLARRDGFPPQKSVLLWTAYMLASEAYTRDLPRAFVSYDALLTDWRGEFARIEAAHGAPLPGLTPKAGRAIDRFLTPDLRHNAGGGDLAGLGWTGALAQEVLDWFEAAAADRDPDPAALARATQELVRRAEEVGPLVSPLSSEADDLRTRLRETRAELEVALRKLEDDVLEHQRERQRLEAELRAFHEAIEAAGAQLDRALSQG